MIGLLELNGLTLVVAEPREAIRPPIMFVHGMLGGAWYFDWYQRFFAERGFPNAAINLRGHHGSRPVPDIGCVPLSEYVADATEAAELLRERHGSPPVVVGHSMGGLIAQKMAEAGVVSAAVLLCAAPPRGISLTTPLLLRKQLKYLPRLLFSRPLSGTLEENIALTLNRVPREECEALHARFVPESGRAGREISFGRISVDERKVRCPVLSVSAGDDRFVVPRVGRALARKYGADYLEFAGHGHFILREPGWEEPAARIAEWIESAVPVSSSPTARPGR